MTAFLLFLTGLLAGSFGALLGLGGGIIVIPVLTMLFHLPIQTAVGVSLVGVVATSTGAAIIHIRGGKADLKLGMLMELGTTLGAIIGAVIAGIVNPRLLYLLYSSLVAYNAYSMYKTNVRYEVAASKDTASGQENPADLFSYKVKNVPWGVSLSTLAGVISGLLGVGGGIIKIPVMYLMMGVPLKVATVTSNLMIGITAAASGFIYFLYGRIDAVVAVPVALGVFIGALAGAWVNTRISTGALKKIFVIVFIYIAIAMARKGLGV